MRGEEITACSESQELIITLRILLGSEETACIAHTENYVYIKEIMRLANRDTDKILSE